MMIEEGKLRIASLELFPVHVPYAEPEVTSFKTFHGATSIVIKLTTDSGLVGWGECVTMSEVTGIVAAAEAARPFVVGRSAWDREAITQDYFRKGAWQYRPMTGNFAFSGIDMALWDLCGKAANIPLYQMLGGAMRAEVDYFYFLQWKDDSSAETAIEEQCRKAVELDYEVFYIKVGINREHEESILEVIRKTIGPNRKLRIDANEAWSLPEALEILPRWHERFRLDFAEAPVAHEPLGLFLDLRQRTSVPLCANEGLWREADVLRVIEARAADYLCFNIYWVGSIMRFHTLARLAALKGICVCKHSHAELGIAAAAGQHLMLAAPYIAEGSQHHGTMLLDDIVTPALPITTGPRWGRIEGPGLGVEVDESRLRKYHNAYLKLTQ